MAGKLASQVRGPSEARFREADGTGERCRAAVEELRWPKGFACPLCGSCEGGRLSARPGTQRRARRHQASPTAGAIAHATRLPPTGRSLAMRPVAAAKDGVSPVELGIKRTDARARERKVTRVTAGREGRKRPDGRVETDDARLGGHRPGRRGRGAAGERPFVAAASTGDDRRPRKIELPPVEGSREEEVRKLVA